MEDIKKQMIAKIALLSKFTSPDSGAFQGEISNAAAKIQEIMDKYSISQSEIEEAQGQLNNKEVERAFESKTADYQIKGLKKWHWDLAKIIAMVTHTKYFAQTHGQRGHMVFFGHSDNVSVATTLFVEWVQIIEMMADSALDDHWKYVMKKYNYSGWLKEKKQNGNKYYDKFMDQVPPEDRTTYFKISWLTGCIQAMYLAACKQQEERDTKTENAIVLYEEKLDNQYALAFPRMRTVKVAQAKVYSSAGYQQGKEAGSKINLTSKKIGE